MNPVGIMSRSAPMEPPPVVSVIVVATDELHHLRECLPSLARINGPPTEVIVVDNASTDGTGVAVATAFPWVNIVRTEQRLGYAPANNLGFRKARGSYLVVLNPDTRVHSNFVSALVAESVKHGDRALVTSRICLFDDPATLNACGNTVHFGLLAACQGLGEPAETCTEASVVAAVSGCAFLVPRSILRHIGPFDESIYPYLEDTELSLRAWIAGYTCVTAPNSIVYHKYSLRLTAKKFYYIERNRWLVMLRCYRLRTFLVLLPALAIVEVLSWAYAISLGPRTILAKARSYIGIGRMIRDVAEARKHMRSLRRISDRALLGKMIASLPVNQLTTKRQFSRGLLRFVNECLEGYLQVALHVVRW
jgi:GT2 family glycosyltransferase